jgi:hypothetical protein
LNILDGDVFGAVPCGFFFGGCALMFSHAMLSCLFFRKAAAVDFFVFFLSQPACTIV